MMDIIMINNVTLAGFVLYSVFGYLIMYITFMVESNISFLVNISF